MKRSSSSVWLGLVGVLVLAAGTTVGACAKSASGPGTGDGGSGGSGGTGGEGGLFMTTSSATGGGNAPDGGCFEGAPNKDNDLDGFTEEEGDCNDCDPNVNPNAVEVLTDPNAMDNPKPVDEDCNGQIDEMPTPCDSALELKSENPEDAAKAIGICRFMKSAKWVLADGSPPPVDAAQAANFHKGHGILTKFGTNNVPGEGSAMLMVSSGTARDKTDPESVYRNFEKGYSSNPPTGFPKPSPKCPNVVTGAPYDATGVEIELDVPTNAKSVSFDFQFFTYEWGGFICQQFNDYFVAQLVPFPMGQLDNGNIAFDALGAPISVNNAFIDACACPNNPPSACTVSGFDFPCTRGKKELVGTPFEADPGKPGWTHGSTGWLRTTTPVTVGQPIIIRFVTFDSTDGKLDSSTLIDNWHWSGTPGTTKTDPIILK